MLVAIFVGCLVGINAIHRTVTYLQHPSEGSLGKSVTSWSVVLGLGLAAFGLSIVNKVTLRRFDPNVGDPQTRIEMGRSRAVTRAEFDKRQQARKPS
jgi:hypothetical protein